MKLTKKTLIALLLAAVVLMGAGGATLAFAAPAILSGQSVSWPGGWPWGGPGGPGRGGVVGTVKSVDAGQLVVTGANSQVITATITSQTKVYLMPSLTEGKVTDIKVGDTVQVNGRRNTSGALEAQSITVGPLQLQVSGQVTGVDGLKISVQAGQGTQTIVTDSNTKFYVSGSQTGSVADVKAGQFITAQVQKQSDGSLLASQVTVGSYGRGRGMGGMMGGLPWDVDGNRVGGQVTAVDGATITIQVGQSTQTIVTNADTKFLAAGTQSGTLADVKAGVFVMAQVQKQSDGSLLATQVAVMDPTNMRPGRMWEHGRGPGQGFPPGAKPTLATPATNS